MGVTVNREEPKPQGQPNWGSILILFLALSDTEQVTQTLHFHLLLCEQMIHWYSLKVPLTMREVDMPQCLPSRRGRHIQAQPASWRQRYPNGSGLLWGFRARAPGAQPKGRSGEASWRR